MEIAKSNRPSRATHPTSRTSPPNNVHARAGKGKVKRNARSRTISPPPSLLASRHVTLERQAKFFVPFSLSHSPASSGRSLSVGAPPPVRRPEIPTRGRARSPLSNM
ncbi:hypothetical protein BDP81DRAFT_216937 [Colletotrichum phormii]|uniref:Uncharacterized protein n=1 Tax=Colletotrichum phormii TaxID=359342 RepID=A0AAJ0EHI4_9PEZI|nr:uncharacterized protein BDP81DRAFT_216937 [Colletotrichum phormii]KAK1636985.1 hypothetical protein BDP81DRAFT_216937 [Colletotrichum phormii]